MGSSSRSQHGLISLTWVMMFGYGYEVELKPFLGFDPGGFLFGGYVSALVCGADPRSC